MLKRLLIIIASVFIITVSATSYAADSSNDSHQISLPRKQTTRFAAVIHYIKQYYIKDVEDKKLFDYAIKGMLSNLDPHSAYLSPQDMEQLQSASTGEFGGIGIKIVPDKRGALKVIAPIDGTPAKKAGIKPGDLIVKINDQIVKDLTLQEAVSKIRGEKGTDVKLVIIRDNKPKPMELKIKRSTIEIETVKSKILPGGFGYTRVSFFQKPAKEDLTKAVKKLKKKQNGHLDGLVLDLRGNPGGLLEPALDVADMFLNAKKLENNKLIVYTEGRLDRMKMKAKAQSGDILNGAPIVVLINNGSASGSEIVAGALQDHRRALIAGQKSFGKGSVQTVMPINQDSGIKLTTALYYTPNGRSIQAEGIMPDINIEPLEVTAPEEGNGGILSEASLEGHLPNGDDKKQAQVDEQTAKALMKLAKKDYQLYQAVNILKAQQIMQRTRQ